MSNDLRLVPIGSLRPNGWNPNTVPEHVMAALVRNIERSGFTQPILVRPVTETAQALGGPEFTTPTGEYEIVDGEHRWHAALALGLETVPIVVTDLSDSEAKAQTLAMNRLRGEMEPAEVARLIREMDEDGLAIEELATFTGYTHEELTDLNALLNFEWDGNTEEEEEPKRDANLDGDKWVTVSWRLPEDVAANLRAELDRLQALLETEHDHLAIEALTMNSVNTPARNVLGE